MSEHDKKQETVVVVNPERQETGKDHLELKWEDVSYSIKTSKSTSKTLIQGMNGSAKAGEMVAIMGGSGKKCQALSYYCSHFFVTKALVKVPY